MISELGLICLWHYSPNYDDSVMYLGISLG
jgi:hypothetical protein